MSGRVAEAERGMEREIEGRRQSDKHKRGTREARAERHEKRGRGREERQRKAGVAD